MNKFFIAALFFVSLALPGVAEARNISVLFVGNSYTYYNDMPQMVAQIAAGDPAGGFTIDAKSATIGGKTLAVLWKDANIQKTFTSQKWDDVVLQEQSEWALFPANIEQTAASIPVWSRAIKAAVNFVFGLWAFRHCFYSLFVVPVVPPALQGDGAGGQKTLHPHSREWGQI